MDLISGPNRIFARCEDLSSTECSSCEEVIYLDEVQIDMEFNLKFKGPVMSVAAKLVEVLHEPLDGV